MKKVKMIATRFAWLLSIGIIVSSCSDDDDGDPNAPDPILTLTELTTGESDGNATVTPGTTLQFMWDARKANDDLETFEISMSGPNAISPVPTSNQGNTFPYDIANADDELYIDTLTITAGTFSGVTTYSFTVTDKNGSTVTKTFDITVVQVMNTTVTGAFFHIQGSLQGSYDLVNDTAVSATEPDNVKDMRNTDLAAATFTGSWESANSTEFVKDNSFDYANASVQSATAAFAAGTASTTVVNPANGDIYIAKLRGSAQYAVIQITNVDPTDNTCNCGNPGKITFDYKK